MNEFPSQFLHNLSLSVSYTFCRTTASTLVHLHTLCVLLTFFVTVRSLLFLVLTDVSTIIIIVPPTLQPPTFFSTSNYRLYTNSGNYFLYTDVGSDDCTKLATHFGFSTSYLNECAGSASYV